METIGRHLEDLRAFHMVATQGGFTRAADVLHQAKSQLSKQVQRLEVALRAKLFVRTTRTLKLTEAGQELLIYSHRIFDLSKEAEHRIQHLQGASGGRIRISMTVSFGESFGPEFVNLIRRELPEVEFELDLSNEQVDFMREKIDFALRASEDHHPDLVARNLGQLKDVICVEPKLLKSMRPITHPKQLETLSCITHSQEESWNLWTLRSAQEEIKIKAQGKISTNQYSATKALCLAGQGVARLPVYIVQKELGLGSLVQVLPEFEISTHPLYLVYAKQEYTSEKVRKTRDILLRWFKENPQIFTKE